MGKRSKEELRKILIAEKMIDATGEVNATRVNYLSGAYTSPLLSEVWDLYMRDIGAMEELYTFLKEVFGKEQFEIMIGILKILYNLCGLLIPDAVQTIYECGERDLKKLYLYEFLEDFQDLMYDFRAEAEAS